MIELVMVYCLTADAAKCIEKRIAMQSPLPMVCMEAGQTEAERYVWDHPQYRLSRWRCEVDLPKQEPA